MSYAEQLIGQLTEHGLWIATAESCSGGLLAAALTDVAGSSAVFAYGLVTYSNEAKHQILGVPEATLAEYGAVSEQTAAAMADGLLRLSGADLALVTTGIAGPGGGSAQKPVGLVYIGCAGRSANGRLLRICKCNFSGDRAAVRRQTVDTALKMALQQLQNNADEVTG